MRGGNGILERFPDCKMHPFLNTHQPVEQAIPRKEILDDSEILKHIRRFARILPIKGRSPKGLELLD